MSTPVPGVAAILMPKLKEEEMISGPFQHYPFKTSSIYSLGYPSKPFSVACVYARNGRILY
jgi:hypothetical protein